jgi:transposase
MPKADVPEKLHKEVKKFAVEHDMTLKDAYAQLIEYALNQKYDKAALKKILREKGTSQDDIIVGS